MEGSWQMSDGTVLRLFGFSPLGSGAELDAVLRDQALPDFLSSAGILDTYVGFITPELKAFEDKALSAQDRALAREKRLYDELLAALAPAAEGCEILVVDDERAVRESLRRALERKEFELYYQPVVRLRDGMISGFEALIRWQHPRLGLLQPVEFIPMAEDSDLILLIGEWVLHTACNQLAAWNAAGLNNIRIGLNVAPRQFQQKNFRRTVARFLAESAIDPCAIELEITESSIMTEPGRAPTAAGADWAPSSSHRDGDSSRWR